MRVYGRCVGRAVISRIPRSWPGSRSIGPSRMRRRMALHGPIERWQKIRGGDPCAGVRDRASTADRNSFVQAYDSPHLDASLLLIPQVGFLPPDDPRVLGTIAAIEHNLVVDGLVLRYSTSYRCGCAPARRRGIPALLVLACRLLGTDRPPRRRRGTIRATARLEQRCRPVGGRIRSARQSACSAISRRP